MTASLTIASNASNSPQMIPLTGTAVNPTSGANTTIHLSLNNIYFYNRAVNSTSAPQPIVVTNSGKAALAIQSMILTGSQPSSFVVSSTCGSRSRWGRPAPLT